ncbi:hypothetical protein ABE137_11705 [Brevibacillus laterosporus]|uniref:hypothetical protein n=1 Tax=Brevibacillus laterosporus TaxID=1465 RepID=UPI003D226767
MKNTPFEYIQKIQAKINKMNLPAFQRHLDNEQNNDVFKRSIQKDIPQPSKTAIDYAQNNALFKHLIQEGTSPTFKAALDYAQNNHVYKHVNDISPTFKVALENRRQNQNITDAFLTTNESIRHLQELVNKISHPLPLQIPDSIYPSIDKLSSTLLDVLPKKEHADSSAPIIEPPSDSQESLELWTWEKLKWFLEIIIPIIITWHLSNVGSEQLDRHHKEDLQQRERHHQELLIEEQKQTKLLEKRIENEKRLTDALNNVTKTIDQYISESPDDPEVDQSDSTSK